MRKNKSALLILVFIFLVIFWLGVFAFSAPAQAANTYFAAPSSIGNKNGSSPENAFQIADFWLVANPGDILYLLDGTYTDEKSMIEPPADYNSVDYCRSFSARTSENPITIKAINNGKAVIDGKWTRAPMKIYCNDYMVFEGIRLQNSVSHVILLYHSSHNIFRNISAYNANYHLKLKNTSTCPDPNYDNFHVLQLVYQSNYNLIEDSIFGGSGRNLMTGISNCNFNIYRRNILIGGGYTRDKNIPSGCELYSDNHGEPSQMYGSSDNVIENVIAFGLGNWEGHYNTHQNGMVIWANENQEAHRNKNLGVISMNYPISGFYHASQCNPDGDSDECLTDNYYENCVAYQNAYNFYGRNGRNTTVKNSMFLDAKVLDGIEWDRGILFSLKFDQDKSSTWSFENVLVTESDAGCYSSNGSDGVDPKKVNFDYVNFHNAPLYGACRDVNKNNDTYIDPQLTSIAYVDENSSVFNIGKDGKPIGADTRCRYISRFEDDKIVTEHTNESLWPLPDYINDRVIQETFEIHGTAYDVNNLVLDELETRDNEKIKCPTENGGTPTDINSDVNSDTHVNIKDIQACIKVITQSDMTYQDQCRVLAAPDLTANIKDIQVIIREIIR